MTNTPTELKLTANDIKIKPDGTLTLNDDVAQKLKQLAQQKSSGAGIQTVTPVGAIRVDI